MEEPMRPVLIACLIILSSFLFITSALADICTDIEEETVLNLNKAECYVLKQVEKGEEARFRESDKWDEKYQEMVWF
jgi:hypothetical protein